MTNRTDRIIVLGAGLIGARHVAAAVRHGRLAAIVDFTDEAKRLAAQHGVPCFDSLEECLKTCAADGVVVATPNQFHAEQAVRCLESGLPVLIEKPIADTMGNAARIADASDRTRVPVLVGHHRRHNAIIKRAKAMIEAGALGRLVSVHGQFLLYKPQDYFDAVWRTKTGGGPLMINLIHDVDLLRHLCGEIVDVEAMRSTSVRGFDVEDTAALMFRFQNGALGTFNVSDTAVAPWSWEMTSGENPIYPRLRQSCYQICGTEASLSLPDLTLWSHDGPRSWWSPMSEKAGDVTSNDAFDDQFLHFLDVLAGSAPLVSASEGMASLKVVLDVAAAAD